MTKPVKVRKPPGRKAGDKKPFLIIADADYFHSEDWNDDKRLTADQCLGEAKDLEAAIEGELSGIIIQVGLTGTVDACYGLAIGAWIRRHEWGIDPILFVSPKKEAALPSCPHLAKLGILMHNRGSSFETIKKGADRKTIVALFKEIPALSEEARQDLGLNFIDDRGRLHTLVAHDMKHEDEPVRILAKKHLRELFRSVGKHEVADQAIKEAEKILAATNGLQEYPEKVVPIIKRMEEALDLKAPKQGKADPKALAGCAILLVEDSTTFAKKLSGDLSKLGAQVKIEPVGQRAFERLKGKHDFCALITDWRLNDAKTGHPQVGKQGFELIRVRDPRITARISLTSLGVTTLSVLSSSLLRSRLPDFRLYRKDDLKIPAVWGLFIQDLADSVRWSQKNIQDDLKKMGMGIGQWTLWQEYFKLAKSDEGLSELHKKVSADATGWWKRMKLFFDQKTQAAKKNGSSAPKLMDLSLHEDDTFKGGVGGDTDSLHKLLLVRRIFFALVSWGIEYDGSWVPAQGSRRDPFLDVKKDVVDSWIMDKFKGLRNSPSKGFLNSLNIRTENWRGETPGLLKEETEWMDSQKLGLRFAVADEDQL